MNLIKGAEVADAMIQKMKGSMEFQEGKKPCLAIVRVGEKPDDIAYERGAVKRLSSLGIECRLEILPADVTQEEFIGRFRAVNVDDGVNGILLLRPLPKQLDVSAAENMISPDKDVDGISPVNTARIYLGEENGYAPCTAQAVMEILDNMGCELRGKKVVIVGCGKVVGKPLSLLMLGREATVTVCNEFTHELENECKSAEILVAAAGVRKLIKVEHVSPECIVIDVGINMDENGKLCGDVDFENVAPVVKGITPVPGGVGSVTTYVLAKHVMQAAGMAV